MERTREKDEKPPEAPPPLEMGHPISCLGGGGGGGGGGVTKITCEPTTKRESNISVSGGGENRISHTQIESY